MTRYELTDDERRVLSELILANGPVNTIRLFDAINPYPLYETGPDRGQKIKHWCQRNRDLEAAEARLSELGLTCGNERGWFLTTAGQAALDAHLRNGTAGDL